MAIDFLCRATGKAFAFSYTRVLMNTHGAYLEFPVTALYTYLTQAPLDVCERLGLANMVEELWVRPGASMLIWRPTHDHPGGFRNRMCYVPMCDVEHQPRQQLVATFIDNKGVEHSCLYNPSTDEQGQRQQ